MTIAHVSLPVTSLSASKSFYLATLAPLSYTVFMSLDNAIGFGPKWDGPDFWIHKCPGKGTEKEIEDSDEEEKANDEGKGPKGSKTHIAFKASSRAMVRKFYDTALKAGATPNGPPGERDYVKGYYAAFVLDPDGYNVECVHYQPLWLSAIQVAPAVVGSVVVAGVAWWVGRGGWVI